MTCGGVVMKNILGDGEGDDAMRKMHQVMGAALVVPGTYWAFHHIQPPCLLCLYKTDTFLYTPKARTRTGTTNRTRGLGGKWDTSR